MEKIDTVPVYGQQVSEPGAVINVILRSLADGSTDTLQLSASEASKMKVGDTLYNRY